MDSLQGLGLEQLLHASLLARIVRDGDFGTASRARMTHVTRRTLLRFFWSNGLQHDSQKEKQTALHDSQPRTMKNSRLRIFACLWGAHSRTVAVYSVS